MRTKANRNSEAYRLTVRPLSKDEGGGYLVEHPEIPGCTSDGETVEEAIANAREALRDTLDVFRESGRKAHSGVCPEPLSEADRQAKREGVSIYSLVTGMIAEAIGSKSRRHKHMQ